MYKLLKRAVHFVSSEVTKTHVAGAVFLATMLGTAAPSLAAGTATYDITPVTTSVSSELTANVPIILGLVGALFALGLAVRMLRKFVKA